MTRHARASRSARSSISTAGRWTGGNSPPSSPATSRRVRTSISASGNPPPSPITWTPPPMWCCTPRTACSAWAARRSATQIDPDLTNAGKIPVTETPGASYFHHADSFAMMRGGHLDVCVLGAFQVSQRGDLANWHTGAPDAIPAVGGAMDLAIGAKSVFVMMTLFAKDGTAKLVPECSLSADRTALRQPGLHRSRDLRHRPRRRWPRAGARDVRHRRVSAHRADAARPELTSQSV